ncbi:hypothetical protein F511_20323 [Dorcoceras hygrometricum]|uniref:Uncharacterized protein n=1 Tax=Dorcoceras hygrometricum TaxID=472368 RepID=A0A2Z7CM60_9LAMI|nr:hypothetical protein F511_20323 [Dorcoceras hygrometricum]
MICSTMQLSPGFGLNKTQKYIDFDNCKRECRLAGTEGLPKGIISQTSNLEVSPLTGPLSEKGKTTRSSYLLAVAVGIKQKTLVNKIVNKFLANDFVVMLFHYDGIVESWNGAWGDKVIHVSAINQTKWWFAKRFLHPDIVAEYDYIFLWDEDLGVEYFHPERYLSIIKEEGLEISQPALASGKSEVHHHITVRRSGLRVHRRYYKLTGGGRCYDNSTAPPCVGWVEMMDSCVFKSSLALCVNDLIHAWGLDMQLGYCAQGDRAVNVGVVDQEYIIHFGLPTLGGLSNENKTSTDSSHSKDLSDLEPLVRLRSYNEMKIFKKRWDKAVKEDKCWVDPYKQPQ